MGKTKKRKDAKKANVYELPCVSIRLVKDPPLLSPEPIRTTQDAVRLLADKLQNLDREVFGVVCLKNGAVPICMNIVSVGTLSATLSHPREIMKSAILANADSVLAFHNHPSGNLEPSREDVAVTDLLLYACELMRIDLKDHVIIGPDEEHYFSFRDNHVLDTLADGHGDLEIAENVADLSDRWK